MTTAGSQARGAAIRVRAGDILDPTPSPTNTMEETAARD